MSTSNSTINDYIKYINLLSDQFIYYFLMVVIPIGFVGNVISVYIYTRPSLNKNTNTGFLYACMCIVNMISIFYYAFVNRSSSLFNYTVTLPCGVDLFLRRTNFIAVSWMQVLITFDRFVAVILPNAMFMRKKVKNFIKKS